jgi:hypothetical protein
VYKAVRTVNTGDFAKFQLWEDGAMRYRVRTPDGELLYESFAEVERAYVSGLVDPDDEVAEEGKDRWRRAATIPQLVAARRQKDAPSSSTQWLFILTFVIVGSVALYYLMHGKWWIGIALALVLGASLTSATAYRAFKRARR